MIMLVRIIGENPESILRISIRIILIKRVGLGALKWRGVDNPLFIGLIVGARLIILIVARTDFYRRNIVVVCYFVPVELRH